MNENLGVGFSVKETKAVISKQEINLVCKWRDKKKEIYNGLSVLVKEGCDASECIRFHLKGMLPEEEGYKDLLCAKIYETFGVYKIELAAKAVTDCLNCVMDLEVLKRNPEDASVIFERYCENVIGMFQEIRPKDIYELMMVTKLIILNDISDKEFLGSLSATSFEMRTIKQNRGVKLSRLFIDFKEKLDKHRQPEQQIIVQHNHIYNEGQVLS